LGTEQTAEFAYNYAALSNEDIKQLNIVTFIQDELTGEILQTATSDTTKSTTTIDELFGDKTGFAFRAYPNPATTNFTVLFSEPVKSVVKCNCSTSREL
jgi:hypothetical protein